MSYMPIQPMPCPVTTTRELGVSSSGRVGSDLIVGKFLKPLRHIAYTRLNKLVTTVTFNSENVTLEFNSSVIMKIKVAFNQRRRFPPGPDHF